MTPSEHYERAENLLGLAEAAPDPLTAHRLTVRAQVHATLASVPWGGAEDLIEDPTAPAQ